VTAGKVTGSKLTGFVERLPDGNRNNGLFWAACRAAEAGQLDGCRDQLIAAALITGLPEHAARATINSADITIANSST
jgi:hypothetical protein